MKLIQGVIAMAFNNSNESKNAVEKAILEGIDRLPHKRDGFWQTYNMEECTSMQYFPEECVIHFYKDETPVYEFNVVPIGTVNPFSQMFRWIWSHPAATELEIELSEQLQVLGDCLSPMFEQEMFNADPEEVLALLALSVEFLNCEGFVNVNLRDTPYYVAILEMNEEPIVPFD